MQAYASAFVLVVGIVFLIAGVARLGFITQFLSKPVMDGFVMGLAIFVAVGQLNKLFGVPKPEGNTVEKLIGIIKELPQANWPTFVAGALAFGTAVHPAAPEQEIPAGLVLPSGAIILSTLLDLEGNYGVAVVGTLPQGLPSFPCCRQRPSRPTWRWCCRQSAYCWVTFSEALGVSRGYLPRSMAQR